MNILDRILGTNWAELRFNQDQPRDPEGTPTGGQWTSQAGSESRSEPRPRLQTADSRPDRLVYVRRSEDPGQIADEFERNWKGIPSDEVEHVAAMAVTRKSFGYKWMDDVEAEVGWRPGPAKKMADIVKELRKTDNGKPLSPADARIDAILRIRFSSGRAIARKW